MNVFRYLTSLLYPKKCPFCKRLIAEEKACCVQCEKTVPYIGEDLLPLHIPELEACYSVFRYDGLVREALLRYKFAGAAAYEESFGFFLGKCIDEYDIICDIVTWAPLSRRRLRERGYDQARLLAERAAAHMGCDCRKLLRKLRNNPPQSGTADAAARRENVAGVYELETDTVLQGKRILLVDDIVTTGSTLSECARTLKKSGASQVVALTVAATLQ